MPTPSKQVRLFTRSELSKLRKATRQEILDSISEHNLVAKRQEKTPLEIVYEYFRARLHDETEEKKYVNVIIFQKMGWVYTKYTYPFTKSKVVIKSTGVQAFSGFPTRRIKYWEFNHSQELRTKVSDFKKLIEKISDAKNDHGKRIKNDIEQAIAEKKSIKEIQKMKIYFKNYHYADYLKYENNLRSAIGETELLPEYPYPNIMKRIDRLSRQINQEPFIKELHKQLAMPEFSHHRKTVNSILRGIKQTIRKQKLAIKKGKGNVKGHR